MGGRMREICAGVNVDIGTAAAFREQWSQEIPQKSNSSELKQQLVLKTSQAPGDTLAMTAAIYSLHVTYPGKFETAVESYWPDVFSHNPDVSQHLVPDGTGNRIPGATDLEMHYPAIHKSNDRAIHFLQGWCEFLGSALGLQVPLATNKPHLYFAAPAPKPEPFWLICSGGKRDFTTKLWGHENYQEVVRRLLGKVQFIQVGGAKPIVPWDKSTADSQIDSHPRLEGTIDMVGKTTLRGLFELARLASGIVCGVSLLMHIAAALEKPAIIIAGGREPVPWNAYPKQQYLHTVGALPCRDTRGRTGVACWRYRTMPLGDNTFLDKDTCERPIDGTPECLRMITPQQVTDLIMRYIK